MIADIRHLGVDDLVRRLDEWMRKNAPRDYSTLRPGLSQREIADYESMFGVRMPDDYRAIYSWKNGEDDALSEGALGLYRWMSTDESLHAWSQNNEIYSDSDVSMSPMLRGSDWWSRDWIPFLNCGVDYECIDLAGSFSGSDGQILTFLLNEDFRLISYPGIRQWLAVTVASVERFGMSRDKLGDPEYDKFIYFVNPGYPRVAEVIDGKVSLTVSPLAFREAM